MISGLREDTELTEKVVNDFMQTLTYRSPFFASILCAFLFSAIGLCAKVETGFIFVERKVTYLIYLLRK